MGSILAVGSQAAGNAGIRNQGGQAGFLGGPGAIDGSAQSFWNLADPFNITGHASSGHFLSNVLDPGNVLGQNQAANPLGQNGVNAQNGGIPSVLPNLGAQSMIPQMPQGGFMPLGQTNPMGGQTPGIFNQMAAQSAGQLFNPSLQAPSPIPFMSNGKGAIGGQGGINGGIVPPMGPSMHGPVGNFNAGIFRGNLPTKAY